MTVWLYCYQESARSERKISTRARRSRDCRRRAHDVTRRRAWHSPRFECERRGVGPCNRPPACERPALKTASAPWRNVAAAREHVLRIERLSDGIEHAPGAV